MYVKGPEGMEKWLWRKNISSKIITWKTVTLKSWRDNGDCEKLIRLLNGVSNHIISYHIISCHVTSFHIPWHITSHQIISYQIVANHIMRKSYYIIKFILSLCSKISCDIVRNNNACFLYHFLNIILHITYYILHITVKYAQILFGCCYYVINICNSF